MNQLANILDYDTNFNVREYEKEPTDGIIYSDQQIPALTEYKDIIKENKNLKREILFLKKQMLEKERKIQKMEFMFGNHK